ncbi:hypothetical protein FA15DRAFT_580231 [Coprinopsis marcescibilis]|uniref:Glycosyltransferase family 31 protein n=1 Tax=Coprinopsis marcescibilis TaxID=230819 RepID=A0A5C3LCD5_COPMA|nr:hypothetical protein FA15DRAFT_580231 [Coprinopsis marcescibilis]
MQPQHLQVEGHSSSRNSWPSTTASTPAPSRPTSPPVPPHFTGLQYSSSCPSDSDSESMSPLIPGALRRMSKRSSNWWSTSRRRRRRDGTFVRTLIKCLKKLVRHPLFPAQPMTIILALMLFTIIAIAITLLLMYILNPDKEPLPWRAYCTDTSLVPLSDTAHPLQGILVERSSSSFPPANLDSLPPAGLFLGVFTVDSSFERRMLIRTTWASHSRSRNGAAEGDGGRGTSRTIVRFILGQPRKDWERRVKLEMETYNDIVILPISENMNSGKTHSFFSWASLNAWVPPVYAASEVPPPHFSYSNYTVSPPPLAPHDPIAAWENVHSNQTNSWTRPDYVVKVDDDSFVMLAELETRLRIELHQSQEALQETTKRAAESAFSATSPVRSTSLTPLIQAPESSTDQDPLVYWGYLITNRLHQFMAGELCALSWGLVDWVAKDPGVRTMTKGAEDKQTAKWMRSHPRADKVRWTSQRCWIYDHPRSGTVYAHGFLFPSEVSRIKRSMMSYFTENTETRKRDDGELELEVHAAVPLTAQNRQDPKLYRRRYLSSPYAWAHSSVSTFGVRYAPPLPNLTVKQSIEALVEGSELSLLHEGGTTTPESALLHREGRRARYENNRVGGTIVVHFIKKNMWFLEAARALLGDKEESEMERYKLEMS